MGQTRFLLRDPCSLRSLLGPGGKSDEKLTLLGLEPSPTSGSKPPKSLAVYCRLPKLGYAVDPLKGLGG